MLPIAIAGGAIALTAAASYVLPGLDQWPYVSINDGEQRTVARIPVAYGGTDGTPGQQCGAWMDVANASDSDMERINQAIATYDWPRLTYGGPDDGVGTQPADPIYAALKVFVHRGVDGIGWGWDDPQQAAPHVSASGVLCLPDTEGSP